jgi:hypothetical protein
MVFFNGLVRDEVTKMARPALLELMGTHSPGRGEPEAPLEVVDAYLKLNPHDDDVREARDRVQQPSIYSKG